MNTIYIEAGVVNNKNITFIKETKDSVAKITTTSNGNNKYYIKFYRGRMINPNEDSYIMDSINKRWYSVTKEVYELYLKFLRTGKVQFLYSAERKI